MKMLLIHFPDKMVSQPAADRQRQLVSSSDPRDDATASPTGADSLPSPTSLENYRPAPMTVDARPTQEWVTINRNTFTTPADEARDHNQSIMFAHIRSLYGLMEKHLEEYTKAERNNAMFRSNISAEMAENRVILNQLYRQSTGEEVNPEMLASIKKKNPPVATNVVVYPVMDQFGQLLLDQYRLWIERTKKTKFVKRVTPKAKQDAKAFFTNVLESLKGEAEHQLPGMIAKMDETDMGQVYIILGQNSREAAAPELQPKRARPVEAEAELPPDNVRNSKRARTNVVVDSDDDMREG